MIKQECRRRLADAAVVVAAGLLLASASSAIAQEAPKADAARVTASHDAPGAKGNDRAKPQKADAPSASDSAAKQPEIRLAEADGTTPRRSTRRIRATLADGSHVTRDVSSTYDSATHTLVVKDVTATNAAGSPPSAP